MISIDGRVIEAKSESVPKFRGRNAPKRFSVTKDTFTMKRPRHKSQMGLYFPRGEAWSQKPTPPRNNSMLPSVSLETMRNIGHFENLPRGVDLGEPNFRRKQRDFSKDPSGMPLPNNPNRNLFPIRKQSDGFIWGSFDRESSDVRTS
jgi:hypothetical protein